MDSIEGLAQGLIHAATLQNLMWCFLGVMLGTMVGMIPGLGPASTISFLLPITYSIADPTGVLIMLAGIYYGAMYGGSTTAILLNLPGEAASTVTTLDGHRMARQGRAGVALGMAALCSFVAGSITVISMTLIADQLSQIALSFGPAEYTSLMILGLALSTALVLGSPLKGLVAVLIGSLLGFVGLDPQFGLDRFTFGIPYLYDGISLIILLLAFYGINEIVTDWVRPCKDHIVPVPSDWKQCIPSRQDLQQAAPACLRGTAIGNILGVLPGGGAVISSIAAYIAEKKIGARRHLIGTGIVEGVAAPEAANNAASQASFIPFLTLGIPTHAVMALMSGAMLIQGVTPGPSFMLQHSELFYALLASFWIGNLLLLVFNLPLLPLFVKILKIPKFWLHSLILTACFASTFYLNYNWFDLVLLCGLSVLAVWLRMCGCEANPLIMGFIITTMLEDHFRRAVIIADGDLTFFVTSWFSVVCYAVTTLVIVVMCIRSKNPQLQT